MQMVHELAKNENGLDSVVWSERVADLGQATRITADPPNQCGGAETVSAPALALIYKKSFRAGSDFSWSAPVCTAFQVFMIFSKQY